MRINRGQTPISVAYSACIIAALGAFVYGFDVGTFGGAQIFVRQFFHMVPLVFGCATSALMFGCLIATTGGIWMQEHLGARRCLSLAAGLFVAGSLGAGLAPSVTVLILFRLVSGVAVGTISIAAPMYITEMAPPSIRGRLGSFYQIALSIAVPLGMALGWILATTLPPDIGWRWMLGSTAVPSVVFLLLLKRIPDSPRWLLNHNRKEEALAIMQTIRGSEDVNSEMDSIRASTTNKGGSFRDLLAPGIRWALVTGVLLGVFNNWTGGTGISLYLPTLFQHGGFPVAGDAVGLTLLAMCFCLVCGLISIRLVDHLGRRLLWMTTASGMMVSVALLGWAYHRGVTGLPIIGLTLMVLMWHNLGLAPLPWLMISELYHGPLRVRAISLCTTVLWLSGFTSVLVFPQIAAWSERHICSTAGVFWVYAGVSLLAIIFGWRILPETKGKTLEQIASHWQVKSGG